MRHKRKGYCPNGARNCQSGKQNIRDKGYNTPHTRHALLPQAVPDPASRIAVASAPGGRQGNRLHEPQRRPERLLRDLRPNRLAPVILPDIPWQMPEDHVAGHLTGSARSRRLPIRGRSEQLGKIFFDARGRSGGGGCVRGNGRKQEGHPCHLQAGYTSWGIPRDLHALISLDFLPFTKKVAPRDGFEPSTNRLTAGCSTAELPGNSVQVALPIANRFG